MANYYTQFSEGIGGITREERDWIESQLDVDRWAAEPPEWVAPVEDECLSFEWSLDEGPPYDELAEGESYLWVYTEETGDPGQVAEFVRAFFARFRPDGCFTLTYSSSCSKPRIGDFSGGAILVSSVGYEAMDAFDWLAEKIKGHLCSRMAADEAGSSRISTSAGPEGVVPDPARIADGTLAGSRQDGIEPGDAIPRSSESRERPEDAALG